MNTFRKSDIPDIKIEQGKVGSISIIKQGNVFLLAEDRLPWMFYDPRPNKKVGLQQQYAMYDLAYGDLLITGFGFGVLLNWLCKKPEIKSITVLEKSKEVVELYLRNNPLPDNKKINIVYTDANTYTDDKHYDCLFLDHLDHEPDMLETSRVISKNISHDVLWLWPLEKIYLEQAYKLSYPYDYFILPDKYPKYTFEEKWEEFRSSINLPTIPNISPEQMAYYTNVYFNNID